MNRRIMDIIYCPECKNNHFSLEAFSFDGQNVLEGRISCPDCGVWFKIENSITDLLPLRLRRMDLYARFAAKHGLEFDTTIAPLAEKDKLAQIEFFKKTNIEYEKTVVNNMYYKSLYEVSFCAWVRNNLRERAIVLDMGCGTGKECITLSEHGMSVIGVDISEEMLSLAAENIRKNRLENRVDLITADAEAPPFTEKIFDACIFCGALHHLGDKATAIQKASLKMKTGGKFYSYDPYDSKLRFIFDAIMKLWKLYDEEASEAPLLKADELHTWLSDANIKPKLIYSTFLPPHMFVSSSLKLNCTLLRATDGVFGNLPIIKNCAGVIVSQGTKIQ